MLLSAVSVLVVVQQSSDDLEGLMNYPVFYGVVLLSAGILTLYRPLRSKALGI
jgi:hypothetical protein